MKNWLRGCLLLGASGAGLSFVDNVHAEGIVVDDLLTSSKETTEWQQCDTDSLAIDVSRFDVASCAYRTTPAKAGVNYKMTCGVSVVDYASITLAFLDVSSKTLATDLTQMTSRQSGASSVTLRAPAGTVTAAVGVYGESGTGFQDCVLVDGAPPAEPTKGSIAGGTWFDQNADAKLDADEGLVAGSPVTLFRDGKVVEETVTDADGTYYFGNLDVGTCYSVTFSVPDSTLKAGPLGGDNDVVSDGSTGEICLTEEVPNIENCDTAFVPQTPSEPPPDFAVCGLSWLDDNENGVFDSTDSVLSDIVVSLVDDNGKSVGETRTDVNGNYAFNKLGSGDYRVLFTTPDGHETTTAAEQPMASSSFVTSDGETPLFNLPADGNSPSESACSVRDVNAGFIKLPVALPATVAEDDSIKAEQGVDFDIDVLANDRPCDGSVHTVDLLGHNVPGEVSFDEASGRFLVSGTTKAGRYNIEYGLRGACGSYDTATVVVELVEPAPVVSASAPEAPVCRVETGGSVEIGGVDVFSDKGDVFSEAYNFYDRDRKLVVSLTAEQASLRVFLGNRIPRWYGPYRGNWEIEWIGSRNGFNPKAIFFVSAIENDEESSLTRCARDRISPIALDLTERGRVERVAGSYDVDIDGDGVLETLTEWFAPSAGILIDRRATGKIEGRHLFGNMPGVHADGFAALAVLDIDDSGRVDGDELGGLAIWKDLDSDTIVDAGETSTLNAHGIVSLALDHYQFMARATLEDGRTLLMEDVWFPTSMVTASAAHRRSH